jgi:NADH-quinone oxidoreductase subunit F
MLGSPDTILERIERSGLRGRGGSWYPVADKWRAVRAEGGEPVVVANGAEGEPGSIKDRHLLRERADDVLAGLELAARAVGARSAFVYLKGGFEREAAALERGLAGRSGLSVQVVRGAESYVGGEETAALEVIEGRRAWPRPKPPYPAAVGLRGQPTLVQNVETLARVPAAVADPEGFRANETTLVSVWGHVRQPGLHEVALGTPLGELVAAAGGALGEVGLLFPGGPSAPPLSQSGLQARLAPEDLRALGSGLGAASLLVVGAEFCPLAVAVSLAGFFEAESCGQCPPCSVGTSNLSLRLRELEGGAAGARDLAHLAEVAGFMAPHGYCAHARTAAASVTGLLARFPQVVAEHLRAGRCPRGGPAFDAFAAASPERRAIEAALERPA